MGLLRAVRRRLGLRSEGPATDLVKCLAAAVAYHLGLLRLAVRVVRFLDRERRLVVLVYHKVVPCHLSETLDGIRPENLDSQIRALRRLFRIVRPEEAAATLKGEAPGDDRYPLLVTFDDGYVNNLRYAAPVLRRHGVPGLFFVTTGVIGTGRFLWTDEVREIMLRTPVRELRVPIEGREEVHVLSDRKARLRAASVLKQHLKGLTADEFQTLLEVVRTRAQNPVLTHHEGTEMLDWDGIRCLRDFGMTIGSHSSGHVILSRLPDEALARDLADSHERLTRELGTPPRFFAYPNGHPGDYDDRVIERLKTLGFDFAFTMVPEVATGRDHPMQIPRYAPGDEPGYVVCLDVLRMILRRMLRTSQPESGRRGGRE